MAGAAGPVVATVTGAAAGAVVQKAMRKTAQTVQTVMKSSDDNSPEHVVEIVSQGCEQGITSFNKTLDSLEKSDPRLYAKVLEHINNLGEEGFQKISNEMVDAAMKVKPQESNIDVDHKALAEQLQDKANDLRAKVQKSVRDYGSGELANQAAGLALSLATGGGGDVAAAALAAGVGAAAKAARRYSQSSSREVEGGFAAAEKARRKNSQSEGHIH